MIGGLGVFVDAAHFLVDERGLVLDKTWEHLLLSGAAIGVALAVAVPLGLWLGHVHRGSFVAINAANIGRALPSLAVIAIGLGFLGFGFTNVLVALVVLAVPPILTNAYVRTASVFVVSSATIAAIAGGGGLGDIIFNQASYRLAGIVAASIVVIALAFAADAMFGGVQRALTPRALRGTSGYAPGVVTAVGVIGSEAAQSR